MEKAMKSLIRFFAARMSYRAHMMRAVAAA